MEWEEVELQEMGYFLMKIISWVVKWLFVTHSLLIQPFAFELQKSKHDRQQMFLEMFISLWLSGALDCANSLFIQSF